MLWNVVECCRVLWNIVKCCGVLWSVVECCGVLWSVVECCGVLWNVVDCCGVYTFCTAVDGVRVNQGASVHSAHRRVVVRSVLVGNLYFRYLPSNSYFMPSSPHSPAA